MKGRISFSTRVGNSAISEETSGSPSGRAVRKVPGQLDEFYAAPPGRGFAGTGICRPGTRRQDQILHRADPQIISETGPAGIPEQNRSHAGFSYMCPAHFLISGGYGGDTRQFGSFGGLMLVNTAVEAMFELRRELFPDAPDEEPYPDRLDRPLVDLAPNN